MTTQHEMQASSSIHQQPLNLPRPVPHPEAILKHPELLSLRHRGITVLRKLQLFQHHDTPTISLYRMYEFLCANDSNQLMLETNYFWSRHEWLISNIPDPNDSNQERKAILASLTESLVAAFNMRFSLGLHRAEPQQRQATGTSREQCPSWTSAVPPLPYELRLYDDCYAGILEAKRDDPFSKRNVVANAGNIWSI